MKPKLLTRDEFREGVFKRDNHKCVICGNPAKDAHHIMERRLFENGGYFMENGVSVCEEHHIQAEQTLIDPSKFYEILGVKRVLPDNLYEEFDYTKWGDIILANKTRLKGPLFNDESVQKVLKSGEVLNLYSNRIKYPRTFHLPWSESKTDDDRTLQNVDHFKGKNVVMTLKMDGEQTTIYDDAYCHARSVDGESHWTQSYVRNIASKVGYNIPTGWRINGENLFAKHSIAYDDLEDFFLLFSVWNEKNESLSWSEVEEWANLLDLKTVEPIYKGIFDEKKIKETWEKYQKTHEGYVLRVEEKFHYSQFKTSMAKFVRKNHVQTSNHWKFEKIEKNKMKVD